MRVVYMPRGRRRGCCGGGPGGRARAGCSRPRDGCEMRRAHGGETWRPPPRRGLAPSTPTSRPGLVPPSTPPRRPGLAPPPLRLGFIRRGEESRSRESRVGERRGVTESARVGDGASGERKGRAWGDRGMGRATTDERWAMQDRHTKYEPSDLDE